MLVRLKKIAAIRAALEDCVEELPEVDCLRARDNFFVTFNILYIGLNWSFKLELKSLKRTFFDHDYFWN